MTPENAKRAAFLLKARDDLAYELGAPEEDREGNRREYDITHLSHMEPEAEFQLNMADDNGSIQELAQIDTGLARIGVEAILAAIDRELLALGIEIKVS